MKIAILFESNNDYKNENVKIALKENFKKVSPQKYDIILIQKEISDEVKEYFKFNKLVSFPDVNGLEEELKKTEETNILIYGSKGWIASQFIEILEKNNIKYTIGTSRVDNDKDVRSEIESVNPTHVISFIGRTHGGAFKTIDYLEQKGKLIENIRDNLFSPFVLSLICKEKGIHYTYLGTGCIFNYSGNHKFNEEDMPNFFGSSYSVVKGFTDRMMHFYDDTTLNVRIRMPITGEDNERNFISKITKYEKICSIENSMTVLPELLPYLLKMVVRQNTGTINLTNPGVINHNEILELYKYLVNPTFTWKNFTIEEQSKILLSERSNNHLDTSKLEEMFPDILSIKDAVYKTLKNYNKMNLLVTGGCGFIGSNFINHFIKKYPNVNIVNVDALYYCADEANVDEEIRNKDSYKFVKGKIQDIELMKTILTENKVTHIIHFAAQSHVQNSFDDSITFTNDNVVGTHGLLEACKQYGKLKRFIHVSTDEVYGESVNGDDEDKKTEYSILSPTNPYAATKAGAEMLAQSYSHSYKFPIIITRGNNVYGPNQYPEKLIPKFIKLLKEDKKVTIQGSGSCVRAFLHVSDTVEAFEKILFYGKIGEIYNIGCDEKMEYSVLDIAKMLIKKIKNTEEYDEWIEYVEDRPFNDQRYYISNAKVKELGWSIKMEFEEGIDQLINQS